MELLSIVVVQWSVYALLRHRHKPTALSYTTTKILSRISDTIYSHNNNKMQYVLISEGISRLFWFLIKIKKNLVQCATWKYTFHVQFRSSFLIKYYMNENFKFFSFPIIFSKSHCGKCMKKKFIFHAFQFQSQFHFSMKHAS